MLNKNTISHSMIDQAQEKLNIFVDSFEDLYGKDNVTMNLHLIRHLPMAVRNLGPLWAQSAYAFEAHNGIVVKSNTCNKEMTHQLAWKYAMKQTLSIEKEVLRQKIGEYSIGGKSTMIMGSTECHSFNEAGIEVGNQNVSNFYKDFVMRGVKYKSHLSIDYFIKLKDNMIGAVRFYIIVKFILYALCDEYEICTKYCQKINLYEVQPKGICHRIPKQFRKILTKMYFAFVILCFFHIQ